MKFLILVFLGFTVLSSAKCWTRLSPFDCKKFPERLQIRQGRYKDPIVCGCRSFIGQCPKMYNKVCTTIGKFNNACLVCYHLGKLMKAFGEDRITRHMDKVYTYDCPRNKGR